MEYIVALFAAVFASNGLWNLIQYRMQRKDKAHTSVEQGVLALLHDKLYYLCEKYLIMGEITLDELDNLKYLFRPYESLGGNGTVRSLYERCKKLPLVEEHKNA